MPFEGCQGEGCHCHSVRILAYIIGRQRICPVCSDPMAVNEDEVVVEEMIKAGSNNPKLLAVHVACAPALLAVRDQVHIQNLLNDLPPNKKS